MAKFPEYDEVPVRPTIIVSHEWRTLRSSFGTEGIETRKQKWLYPRRRITLRYENISKSNGETLWQFFLARKGSFNAFNFFMPEPELDYPAYTGEYVGTGDGSNGVFNLPCKTAVSHTLYLDGFELTEGTNYTFNSGGGADGADQIDMEDSDMVVPSDGGVLTIDFTGILKVHCRFAEDILDFQTFRDLLVTTGIELQGLLNE